MRDKAKLTSKNQKTQARRRARLDEEAQALGFSSWTKFETAVKSKAIKIAVKRGEGVVINV
jgi:hypothetical protein